MPMFQNEGRKCGQIIWTRRKGRQSDMNRAAKGLKNRAGRESSGEPCRGIISGRFRRQKLAVAEKRWEYFGGSALLTERAGETQLGAEYKENQRQKKKPWNRRKAKGQLRKKKRRGPRQWNSHPAVDDRRMGRPKNQAGKKEEKEETKLA